MKIYWNGESKNIIGSRVKELWKAQGIFQKMLAARLQTEGFEFMVLTILRIEQGKRFVPDYEIVVIADYFHVSADYLLGIEKRINEFINYTCFYSYPIEWSQMAKPA